MRITRECDYAIRSVRALSDYQRKTVKEISSMEHIPLQYSYKILKKLEKSGIVQSSRGPDGGYMLLKKLQDFTLFDIIQAVEEDFFLNECLNGTFECPNHTENCHCSVHAELCRIQQILEKELCAKSVYEVLK